MNGTHQIVLGQLHAGDGAIGQEFLKVLHRRSENVDLGRERPSGLNVSRSGRSGHQRCRQESERSQYQGRAHDGSRVLEGGYRRLIGSPNSGQRLLRCYVVESRKSVKLVAQVATSLSRRCRDLSRSSPGVSSKVPVVIGTSRHMQHDLYESFTSEQQLGIISFTLLGIRE
jgi:hypothetical protein